MKLVDIAKSIDKSSANESYVSIMDIASILGINMEWVEQSRLKSYWIGSWYCTDSHVGYKMYFLDDEPVAFSIKKGRKCDEDIHWFSRDVAIKVRDYVTTLLCEEDIEENFILCDINGDIGDSYKIQYGSQIMHNSKATLKGEPVDIISRVKDSPDYGIDKRLIVRLTNSQEIEVHIRELDFKFHLK
jgi:hypothetical protein